MSMAFLGGRLVRIFKTYLPLQWKQFPNIFQQFVPVVLFQFFFVKIVKAIHE